MLKAGVLPTFTIKQLRVERGCVMRFPGHPRRDDQISSEGKEGPFSRRVLMSSPFMHWRPCKAKQQGLLWMNPWQHGQHTHDLPTWKTDGQKPKRAIPPHAASLGSPGAVATAAGRDEPWLTEPRWDVQGWTPQSSAPSQGKWQHRQAWHGELLVALASQVLPAWPEPPMPSSWSQRFPFRGCWLLLGHVDNEGLASRGRMGAK